MSHNDRIALFQALVDEDPDNELARFSLGQALFEAERHADAEPHFRRTCELQPDHMLAYLRRAECLLARGLASEARPLLLQTIALAKAQNHVGPRLDAEALLEEIDDA
jgi:tetratricopeptide (TPR) repeat protein